MNDVATRASPPRLRWLPHVIWALVVLATVGWLGRGAGWPAGGRLHLADVGLLARQPVALLIHLLAFSLAVPLGVVMMVSPKGQPFHRAAGWIWTGLVLVGASALLWRTLVDGHPWGPLHLLLIWVLPLLTIGLWFARRHRRQAHSVTMMWLFYGSILFPGALTFLPGRLMWRLFFG